MTKPNFRLTLIVFFFFAIFFEVSSISKFATTGQVNLEEQETIASIGDKVITTKDVRDIAVVMYIISLQKEQKSLKNAQKPENLNQFIKKNITEILQSLIQIYMQIVFFEGNNFFKIFIDNNDNFKNYIKAIQKETGISEELLKAYDVNYKNFIEQEKAKFTMMAYVSSAYRQSNEDKNKTKQQQEEDMRNKTIEVMNEIKNQSFVDFK